jgi:hypothetical protein
LKNYLKFKNGEGIEFEIIFRKPDKRTWGDDCDGVCFLPSGDKSKIYVNPWRTDQTHLNTIIHETTHAYFWDKSEKEVTAFANTLSRILYNDLKWRRSEK